MEIACGAHRKIRKIELWTCEVNLEDLTSGHGCLAHSPQNAMISRGACEGGRVAFLISPRGFRSGHVSMYSSSGQIGGDFDLFRAFFILAWSAFSAFAASSPSDWLAWKPISCEKKKGKKAVLGFANQKLSFKLGPAYQITSKKRVYLHQPITLAR